MLIIAAVAAVAFVVVPLLAALCLGSTGVHVWGAPR